MEAAAHPEYAMFTDIGKRNRAQKEVDLIAELFPQIVGHAARLVSAATDRSAGGATGRPYRFVDCQYDVGDTSRMAIVSEQITAARPAYASHEPTFAQHRKELLEVGQ